MNTKENHVAFIMWIIIILVVVAAVILILTSNANLFSNENTENNKSGEQVENLNDNNVNENKNKNNNNNSNSNNNNSDKSEQANDNTNNKPATAVAKEEKETTPQTPTEVQIATYTTTLYDKEQTRIDNINLAISKLNGVIIENGAEFSFNNTIGPMNEGNGFKKATGFDSNGKKIKISGGGICQISSTLYNCALIAGFNITERHPHSKRVYYVPKDKDATILYGSLDLKFVNNSGSKVRINASATKSTVTITLVKIK